MTGIPDLLMLAEKATGPDRELDGMLMCLHRGWRFIRYADGNDFAPAYRDVEPAPGYEGAGGRVHKGTMIYFNPDPGPNGQHHQLWSAGGFTPYTSSIDAALGLVEQMKPGWFWRAGHVPSFHWHNGANYDNWCHLSRTNASNCDRDDEATGWANSVPLAIIVALLRSLIQEHKDGQS